MVQMSRSLVKECNSDQWLKGPNMQVLAIYSQFVILIAVKGALCIARLINDQMSHC